MGRITLNIKFSKSTDNILSVEHFKERFLYGVKIGRPGEEMPDSVYEYYLQFAKEQVEHFFTIKLDLQIHTENKAFHLSDWMHWSLIKCTYPVVAPISVSGTIGNVQQVDYPKEWISIRRTSNDELYSRVINIVPNTNTPYQQIAAIYTGVLPNAGWIAGGSNTPNYWNLSYVTGMKKIPADIETAIGMLAAINILTVGNETMAAALGILGSSSKSISIDGLSESANMYINGATGIFSARIKQYTETLNGVGGQDGLLKRLQDYFGAFIFAVA